MEEASLDLSDQRRVLTPKRGGLNTEITKPTQNEFKTLTSPHPINQIPIELLILIFKHTIYQSLGGHSVHFDPIRPESTFPANKLSSICRRWRTLALSTPDLWSDISINSLEAFERCHLGWLDALKLHLERSKDSPIGIALTLGIDEDLESVSNLPPFFDLLGVIAPHSHWLRSLKAFHLETLSFVTTEQNVIDLNESISRSSFPRLQELSVAVCADLWSDPTHQTQVHQSLQRPLSSLPWHQITTLGLELDYSNDIPTILLGCPAVASLTISLSIFKSIQMSSMNEGTFNGLPGWFTRDGDAEAVSWQTTRERTILSHLQELTLRISTFITPGTYIATSHLLEVISCPSLVSLSLEGTGVTDGSASAVRGCLNAVCGFLQSSGSGTRLRRLALTEIPINRALFGLLHGPTMNGLEYLSIREPNSYYHSGGSGDWLVSLLLNQPTVSFLNVDSEGEETRVIAFPIPVPLPNLRDLHLALAVPLPLISTLILTAPALLILDTFESIVKSRTRSNILHSAVLELPLQEPYSGDVHPHDACGFASLRQLQKTTKTAIKVVSSRTGEIFVGYNDEAPEARAVTRDGMVRVKVVGQGFLDAILGTYVYETFGRSSLR
ncbi:hypothetical protein AAF712_006172 [Marasmius tenuissimus]|uniref:F-box domain-containing protein n=1 Tax=Marasmius tenuissimus TaxID=585030 RepID=A0ABR2ZYK2_9AGAR